jgi:thioester reductase-like protein
MAGKLLMTGFPGFIAKQLAPRLGRNDPDTHLLFLVQPSMRKLAEASLRTLDEHVEGLSTRCSILEGDITQPRLGMAAGEYERCTKEVSAVWHLAAAYDLAVAAAVAYRVNVIGTACVLDFCEACESFERLDYLSTCYVSGTRHGLILESELDEGQSFKNHYESTKCWAEMEVRRRMGRIPTCVHRPGVVVGDSRTGETDKYDGPYFLMLLLLRLPARLPMPNIGRGDARVNLVPVDFLTDAMAAIGANPTALGKTVHLADPDPRSAREVMAKIQAELGRPQPAGLVPPSLVARALRIPAVRRMVKVPEQTVTYFNHEVLFDTTNQASLLTGTGLYCPDFFSYLPTLLDYVRAHPEKAFLDGRTW